MVSHIDYPRLCGGTFFVLLLQAIKQRSKARDRYSGGSDGLADPDVLKGLLHVAQPHYVESAASTFAHNTSSYKACAISYSAYLPFNEPLFVAAFDRQVKVNYTEALSAMSEFARSYVDVDNMAKCERLVKALLEVIESDQSILDSDVFYVRSDGQPLRKAMILDLTDLSLQSFLLGIWHFVVVNRPDNKIGRSTFEQWHEEPATKGQPWRFTNSIGENSTRPIHLVVLGVMTGSESIVSDDEPETPHDESPDEDAAEGASASVTNQIVDHPLIFNQYGNNNVQIGLINTLTINN